MQRPAASFVKVMFPHSYALHQWKQLKEGIALPVRYDLLTTDFLIAEIGNYGRCFRNITGINGADGLICDTASTH